jgi:hypothetical protein
MKNKSLLEEINRFKYILNYNPLNPDLINEADKSPFEELTTIPKLRGNAKSVQGTVNLGNTESVSDAGVTPIAWFKNKGLFQGQPKKLYLNIAAIASKSNANLQAYRAKKSTDDTPTPTPTTETKPMTITFSLEGGFNYDRTSFNTEGETIWQDFIAELKKLKEDNLDQWPNFIRFLRDTSKKNQIFLRCYASIDGPDTKGNADTNNKKTTTLPRCRVSGGRLRSDYDLCLSQVRAEDTLSRLEKDFPDLKGIFKAKGEGQTSKWGNNSTEDTRSPNRRLVLDKIPTYMSTINYPDEDEETKNKKAKEEEEAKNKITLNTENTEIEKFGPKEEGEYIYWYCKYYKKSDGYYILDNKATKQRGIYLKGNREYLEADGSTIEASPTKIHKEQCESSVLPALGVWDLGNGIQLSYWNALNNAENIMIKKSEVIDIFENEENFFKYVPFYVEGEFFGTTTPNVVVDNKGVFVTAEGFNTRFPGWTSASEKIQMQNMNAVASTDLIPSVVKFYEQNGSTFYEIGYTGFVIQKPTQRYKG